MPDRKVTVLPRIEPQKRVAIYCRVSSASREQIHSLINQISFLTMEVGSNPDFRIVGIYMDVYSGSSVSGRPEYKRLLKGLPFRGNRCRIRKKCQPIWA